MNELVPARPEKPLTLTDCRISTGLWRQLASDLPAEVALEAIVSVPALHAEARASIPALTSVAEPCGAQKVREALQPLVLVYGVGEAAKSAAFWRVYVEQLSGFPAEALAQAVNDYAGGANAEFFPKPGPLKALAAKRTEPILKALSRAKRAASMLPPKVIPPQDVETRKALVAKMLAGFTRPPANGDKGRAA